jgi:UDP-N-acetylglucosamine acyltransferase
MGIDASARVHPTAVVEAGATIGPGAEIGPYAVIGPKVTLGPGVTVKAHALVTGRTTLAEGVTVFPFAAVGELPQDLKYRGEDTAVEVGPRTRIREHTTIHIGTAGGGGVTRIGADCLIMANCHIAHDCRLGDRVIIVGGAMLAGHVQVGDDAIVGGLAGVHQWVRIGRGAIVGGMAKVVHDVLPHAMVDGPHAVLEGPNLVGLKRRGVPREDIAALRAAFRALASGEGAFLDRVRALAGSATSPFVREIVDFVLAGSDRSFHTPR